MFTERNIYRLGRIPDYAIWAVATLFMTFIANRIVGNIAWLSFVYFPLFLFLGGLSSSGRFVGFAVARRGVIALWAVIVGILLLALVILFYPNDSVSLTTAQAQTASRTSPSHIAEFFLVIGSILGALARDCISRLITSSLLGKKRLGQNLLATAIWTIGIVLFPWSSHKSSATWYIFGMILGVLISRGFRLRFLQAVAAYRRIQDIFDAWPPNAQATKAELEAIKLLARGRQLPLFRFSALREKLEYWRVESDEGEDSLFTRRLALVSATVYRLEGQHQSALAETADVTEPIKKIEDAHLLLLRSLSLFELGKEDEAHQVLSTVLRSDLGSKCPFAKAILAIRKAEDVLAEPSNIKPSREPLDHILTALDLRRNIIKDRSKKTQDSGKSIDLFLARFAEIGVPITASLMLDILGYCHLAAGFPEEGRILLEKCIDIDRSFSTSYLHLGDYFLLRRPLYGSGTRKKSDLWHAEACYYAAMNVERNKNSRVRRLAKRRLKQVENERSRTAEATPGVIEIST